MEISRPLGEVLEALRCADAGLFVSAADIIPERTRPRRALPKSG